MHIGIVFTHCQQSLHHPQQVNFVSVVIALWQKFHIMLQIVFRFVSMYMCISMYVNCAALQQVVHIVTC